MGADGKRCGRTRAADGNRDEDGKRGRLQLRKGIGVQNHACVGKTSFFSQSRQRLERRSFQIQREYVVVTIRATTVWCNRK